MRRSWALVAFALQMAHFFRTLIPSSTQSLQNIWPHFSVMISRSIKLTDDNINIIKSVQSEFESKSYLSMHIGHSMLRVDTWRTVSSTFFTSMSNSNLMVPFWRYGIIAFRLIKSFVPNGSPSASIIPTRFCVCAFWFWLNDINLIVKFTS